MTNITTPNKRNQNEEHNITKFTKRPYKTDQHITKDCQNLKYMLNDSTQKGYYKKLCIDGKFLDKKATEAKQ